MLLRVSNLAVSYGAIEALHGVTLHIDPGEIVTLIGANGAGKTTLLRTISGLLRPTRGSIEWMPANAASNRSTSASQPSPVIDYESQPATEGLQRLPPHE